MKYEQKRIKGMDVYCTSIHTRASGKEIVNNFLIAESKQQMRVMARETIKDCMKQNRNVTWNKDTEHEVSMQKVTEYDDADKTLSEFVTRYTVTMVGPEGKRKQIEHKISKTRNPAFADNPECEFCHKPATKLYDARLINEERTPVKVHAKCKKELAEIKEIWERINKG